jgi:hypothetical protein
MYAVQQLPRFNEEIGYGIQAYGTIQSPARMFFVVGRIVEASPHTSQVRNAPKSILHQLLHAPQFALPLRLLLRISRNASAYK